MIEECNFKYVDIDTNKTTFCMLAPPQLKNRWWPCVGEQYCFLFQTYKLLSLFLQDKVC